MGNAGSMDSQQTDFRAHNVPLKLPMPEPGELEERFAIVLVSARRGSGRGDAADPRPLLFSPRRERASCPKGEGAHLPLCGLPSLTFLRSPLAPALRALGVPGWGRGLGPGCLAGPEPIVWREKHLAARVPGRCGVGVKERWRGPGRRGWRAAKAFCLKIQ